MRLLDTLHEPSFISIPAETLDYGSMSLEEKRSHYKCGRDYLTLHGIPTWSNSHKSKLTETHCSARMLLETENPHGNFSRQKSFFKATCPAVVLPFDEFSPSPSNPIPRARGNECVAIQCGP